MQDPICAKIESIPRPTLSASSAFVLLATAGLWASTLFDLALPGADMLGSNAFYYLPFLALPMFLYSRRRPGLSEALRLNPLPLLSVPALALLAILSMYLASALSAAWGAGLDALGLHSPGALPPAQSEGELALSIVAVAALPAVCEELLFRGFALSAWETRGTWYAVGVTALLFALLHGNLYGLPSYLLVGAAAGFVTFALDSVYAGIVYHTLYNASCLIVPWLLARGSGATAEATVNGMTVLFAALETLAVCSMAAALLASLRLRARREGIEPIPRIRRPLTRGERAALLAAVAAMLLTNAAVLILTGIMAAQSGGAT